MADSVIIGRVAVKVMPDTKSFRRDTQRDLNRIEKALKLKVNLGIQVNKTQMREVQRKLDKLDDDLKVDVDVDLQSGALKKAQFQLAALGRNRIVRLIPVVSKPAAAKAATALAALSGGRLIGNIFKDLGDMLKNLDKTLPLIGGMTLAILNLGAAGIASASNLFALSSSLASIAGAGLALPGLLAGIGVGLGITIIGLSDMKKVLPDVFKQLQDLKHLISRDFWKGAKSGIQELVTVYLPHLGSAAKEVGTFWGRFAHDLAGPFKRELPVMFANLRASISETTKHTESFAGVITKLGTTGSQYLPRLAAWVGTIADRFDKWLGQTLADGRLTGFIEAGISALKDLGNVLKNVGSIFAGLGRAAQAAGGSTLAIFADTLQRISNVVNGPTFQAGMTKVFAAAHTAISALATQAGPALLDLFSTLSETLGTLLPLAGRTLGTLLSSIATALAQPAFQAGFASFISGLAAGLTALAPAAAPLGKALGALGAALGALAQVAGEALGVALTGIANVFIELLPAIQGLIPVLGDGLVKLFQILAPVLVQVAQALAPVIVSLGPVLGNAITALVPIVTTLAQQLGTVLLTAIQQIGPLLPQVVTSFAAFAVAVAPLVPQLLALVTALLPIAGAILTALVAGLPLIVSAFSSLATALQPVIAAVMGLVNVLSPVLIPVLKFVASLLIDTVVMAIKGVTNVIKGATDFIQGTIAFWSDLFTGQWGKLWGDFLQVLKGAWELILGALQLFIAVGAGKVLKLGFIGLKAIFKGGWVAIEAVGSAFFSDFLAIMGRFGVNLLKAPGATLRALRTLFSDTWDLIRSAASSAFSNMVGMLTNAGRQLIAGFISGIKGMIGSVKTTLQDLTSKLTSWKGPEQTDRTLLVGAGQLVIEGFINGLESRYDAVRRSLQGLTADMRATDFAPLPIPSMAGAYGAIDAALASGSGGVAPVNVNINGNVGWDPDEVAQAISEKQQDANTITQLTTGVFI